MPNELTLRCVIERKDPRLPRFAVIPASALESWQLAETTTVDAAMNGIDIGRRSLKRWDDARWWLDIPDTACKAAGVDTGACVTLRIAIADASLPAELQQLIDTDPSAKANWLRLTSAQQRMLREEVASAKQSETRMRRARRVLT